MSRLKFNRAEEKAFLIFTALLRLFPGVDFFPRLKELVIVPSPSRESVHVPFSLLRFIDSLVIEQSPKGTSNISNIMEGLIQEGSPNALKNLSLSARIFAIPFFRWNTSSEQSEWQGLRRLFVHHKSSIRRLTLDQAPALPLVRMIAELEVLETLDVSDSSHPFWGTGDAPLQASENPYSISFDEVRTINFQFSMAFRRFQSQHIRLPKLEKLTFTQTGLGVKEILILPQILDCAGFFPGLRYLDIKASDFDSGREREHHRSRRVVESGAFTRLLQCGNLEYLHVAWPSIMRVNLTDDLAKSMAMAWPSMTHLYIDPALCTGSKVAFSTIGLLGRSFERLELLGLLVDQEQEQFVSASEIDILPQEVQECRPNMRSLNIGAPRLNDVNARHAAEFLMTIFPGLEHIAVPPNPPRPEPRMDPDDFTPFPPAHAKTIMAFPFHPPAPWEREPGPPREPEWEDRLAVIAVWAHVVRLAAEMRRRGARKIGQVLREMVRSDPKMNLDMERVLIEKGDGDADYMAVDEDEAGRE